MSPLNLVTKYKQTHYNVMNKSKPHIKAAGISRSPLIVFYYIKMTIVPVIGFQNCKH